MTTWEDWTAMPHLLQVGEEVEALLIRNLAEAVVRVLTAREVRHQLQGKFHNINQVKLSFSVSTLYNYKVYTLLLQVI